MTVTTRSSPMMILSPLERGIICTGVPPCLVAESRAGNSQHICHLTERASSRDVSHSVSSNAAKTGNGVFEFLRCGQHDEN
jgi:hypothetical protein